MFENILVTDIETVPDTELGRRLLNISGTDEAVAREMMRRQQEKTGSDFLPHEQHRVVSISCVLRTPKLLRVWSLGEPNAPEEELVKRFFQGIERYRPHVVTWNGGGFDLPVLHYRALRHSIVCPEYWDRGDMDKNVRWNNYRSRYHEMHIDVMDVLSSYQGRSRAQLDTVSKLIGLPGKLDMHGDGVLEQFLAGKIVNIRNYCETDVINTFLVFMRFQLIRGHLNREEYEKEVRRMRDLLVMPGKPHFQEYLQAWEAAA